MSFGLTLEKVSSLFKVAGFKHVDHIFQTHNTYGPDVYVEWKAANPCFLVKTPSGLIEIGPRKRVIEIDWRHTALRKEPANIGPGEVTKSETHVHCWEIEHALQQLTWLRIELEAVALAEKLKPLNDGESYIRQVLRSIAYNGKVIGHPLSGERVAFAISMADFHSVQRILATFEEMEQAPAKTL